MHNRPMCAAHKRPTSAALRLPGKRERPWPWNQRGVQQERGDLYCLNNVPFKNRMYKNGGIAAPFSYATPTRYLSRSLQRVTGNLYGSAMAAADRVGRRKLANEPLRVGRG